MMTRLSPEALRRYQSEIEKAFGANTDYRGIVKTFSETDLNNLKAQNTNPMPDTGDSILNPIVNPVKR